MLTGSNFLTTRYRSHGVSVPVGFPLVAKEQSGDPKTQKEQRRRPGSKKAVCPELSKQALTHLLPLRFVLFAGWFAAAETLGFLKQEQHRDFIGPLQTKRKGALSRAEQPQGRYPRVATRDLEAHAPREVYREGGDFPLVLVKDYGTKPLQLQEK